MHQGKPKAQFERLSPDEDVKSPYCYLVVSADARKGHCRFYNPFFGFIFNNETNYILYGMVM